MPRPTLLVAEPEPMQALSVRKLMLETGKFNVITAHSTNEGTELFAKFPRVDAIILVSGNHIDCDQIAREIRQASDEVKIIHLAPNISSTCPGADFVVSSYEPEELMKLVRRLFGDPRQIDGK